MVKHLQKATMEAKQKEKKITNEKQRNDINNEDNIMQSLLL